jgi:hypothetical protein
MLVGHGDGPVAARLAGLGGRVEAECDPMAAVEALAGGGSGYGLTVIECDGCGGLEAAQRLVRLAGQAGAQGPVILISTEVGEQIFPTDPAAPVLLRAPLTAVSLRLGFEHALRGRLIPSAA